MGWAVSDTGPINYLVLIDWIDLLPRLFDGVSISETVRDELDRAKAPSAVRTWIARPPSWLIVEPDASPAQSAYTALDKGEQTTIDLAARLQCDTIIMDDRAGVAAARSRAFTVTGTLGLLVSATQSGFVDFPVAIARLRATNFHVRREFLDQLLADYVDK